MSVWKTEESFEVCVKHFEVWIGWLKGHRPPNALSVNVVVTVDDPENQHIQLGRIELDTDYLQDLSLHRDNSMYGLMNYQTNSLT